MSKWQGGPQPKGQDEWEEAGRDALLDLLSARWVIPWAEAEARISGAGWNDFPKVQSLQLHAARVQLVADGKIIVDTSKQLVNPVVTVRLPFPKGRVKELGRLRGARRKAYRKFLSWATDQPLCGSHAERVVIDTARMASSDASLFVPKQRVGDVDEVAGLPIVGTFDGLAYLLDPETIAREASLVFEVKNVNDWLYPWQQEPWELLVRAARIADQTPIVPVLVCARAAYQTWNMSQDLGFHLFQFQNQLFNPSIDAEEFDALVAEFGLPAERGEAPHPHVWSLLTKTIRGAPPSPPREEGIEFWQRQLDRFRTVAPVISRFDVLAKKINDDARKRSYAAFKAAVAPVITWQRVNRW